jgi:hypothetical protein
VWAATALAARSPPSVVALVQALRSPLSKPSENRLPLTVGVIVGVSVVHSMVVVEALSMVHQTDDVAISHRERSDGGLENYYGF